MIGRAPISLKAEFLLDPEEFIKSHTGIPQEALSPFIKNISKAASCLDKNLRNPFDAKLLGFDNGFECRDSWARYMHLDLAISGDRAGIAMAHVSKFLKREKLNDITKQSTTEYIPHVVVDFHGGVEARPGQEISLQEIRDLIIELADNRKFPIRLITMDQFQSTDTKQLLSNLGFLVARLSIDRTTTLVQVDSDREEGIRRISTNGETAAAMICLKELIYQNRLSCPYSDLLLAEIRGAERSAKTGKVNHRKRGSIDVMQAVAGACYNAVNNETYFPSEAQDGDDSEFLDSFYGSEPKNIDLPNGYVEDSYYREAEDVQTRLS